MSRAGYLSERQYSRRKLGLLSVRGEVTQSARWVSSLEGVADGGNGRWHLASPWREPRSGRWPIRTNASPLDHTACEEGLVTLPHLPLRFVVKGPQVDVGQGARHRLRPRGACCPHHVAGHLLWGVCGPGAGGRNRGCSYVSPILCPTLPYGVCPISSFL